jgi:hypothetical protein
MKKSLRDKLAIITGISILFAPIAAFAANTPTLNQTINAGTLSTNIYQSDDVTPVASPTVAFAAKNVSFSCQTSTATLGDTNNKVNVTNMAANNGWTLAIAATSGFTATWTNGTNTYKFNDATGTGCTNGQLTVDPSVATLTDDCSSTCSDATVTKGSSTAFNHATTTDSVTLLSNSSGAAWEGYLTGISMSQKIPASQPSGSYSLGMTITATAQ